MVLDKRLELLRLSVLDPKSSVSANSTNPAYMVEPKGIEPVTSSVTG